MMHARTGRHVRGVGQLRVETSPSRLVLVRAVSGKPKSGKDAACQGQALETPPLDDPAVSIDAPAPWQLLRRLYYAVPSRLGSSTRSNIVDAPSSTQQAQQEREGGQPVHDDATQPAASSASAAPASAPAAPHSKRSKPHQQHRHEGQVHSHQRHHGYGGKRRQQKLHTVLDLMARRMREGSQPGERPDGCKLGLVVEGGGMRGIVTGAMLMGLLDAGLRGAFDAVYGASAGAINATYFLTGQREGLDIYTKHLAPGDRFLSLRRYWSSGPAGVMDLSYLLDDVMVDTIPLDWGSVIDSPLPLKVVASSLDTLRAETLTEFESQTDLSMCLRASANVPEIVGGPIDHRGHRLVDAAVFEPVPVKAAMADGCTHVLVLCSRPPNVRSAWGQYLQRSLTLAVKRTMLNPPYMREAWAAQAQAQAQGGVRLEELLESLAHEQAAAAAAAAAQADIVELPGTGGGRPTGLAGLEEAQVAAARLEALAAKTNDPADAAAAAAATAELLGVDRSRRRSGSSRATPGTGFDLSGGSSAARLYGADILPIYPGSAASFAPICKDVSVLEAGRREGFQSILAAVAPALAAARC